MDKFMFHLLQYEIKKDKEGVEPTTSYLQINALPLSYFPYYFNLKTTKITKTQSNLL